MGAGASTSKSRVKDREVIKTTTSLDSGVNGAKQENDMNLPSVLSDPLLWNIFREWLGGVFADKYLMCWTDIDTFETLAKTSLDKKKIRARAVHLYKKYVDPEGHNAVGLDESERENVRSEIGLGGTKYSYSTKDKRFNTLSSVYHDAKLKIFQQVRYDYFPHFLGSYNSEELTDKIRHQVANELERSADSMDGSNFMASSFVLKYFREYLFSCPLVDGLLLPSDYLDCLLEIKDFKLLNKKETRVDRLQLIFHRYKDLNLPMPDIISNAFDAKPGKFSDPNYGLNGMNWMRVLNDSGDIQGPVHKVKNLAKKNRDVQTELNMMERTGMSTTGSLPMNTNNGFCRSAHFVSNDEVMKRNTRSCPIYNNSSYSNGDTTLEVLLDDPLGVSMFKRFNYENYQEENINFWIAVKAFHRDDLVAPQGCKKILDVRDDMTFEQLRLMRARMICEEFINEGSPREVNVSKSMRECIQQRIDSNNISKDVFDDAHLEILKLMKLNLWSRFTKTAMFAFFSQKHRKKEARQTDNTRNVPEMFADKEAIRN